MSETADVLYKITAYFAPQSERSIGWDDSTIGIVWPDVGIAPILSDKDRSAPWLSEADVFD
jgi:dTDP-4-dehydrorhamnose 3,5-epimerase